MDHTLPLWMIFTLVALVFWGITGVTQKLATNYISSQLSFIWYACAILAISFIVGISGHVNWHLRPGSILTAVAGGMLNGLGTWTSFKALESGGKASVVIALIALYPLLTVSLAVIFLHEHVSAAQGIGIACALVAAILLSMEPAKAR